MMPPGPIRVPRRQFSKCVHVLEELPDNASKASLLAGLVGFFLSGVPWEQERVWSEAITRLGVEAAAVARNSVQSDE